MKKYKYNGKMYSIREFSEMSEIPIATMRHRIYSSNGVINERILNPKSLHYRERKLSAEELMLADKLCGFTLKQIVELTGDTYKTVRKKINDGFSANQLVFGVFGKSGKSMLDAWSIAMNAPKPNNKLIAATF